MIRSPTRRLWPSASLVSSSWLVTTKPSDSRRRAALYRPEWGPCPSCRSQAAQGPRPPPNVERVYQDSRGAADHDENRGTSGPGPCPGMTHLLVRPKTEYIASL